MEAPYSGLAFGQLSSTSDGDGVDEDGLAEVTATVTI